MSRAQTKSKTVESNRDLNVVQCTSYILPAIPIVLLYAPISIIQGVYAKHYGLALTTLATILLVSRIFDAISDPIVGYLSDRYRAKHGTRKPFIIAGSLLTLLCGYFLYNPPADGVSVFYAGFWMVAIFTAFTLFEIPHVTWPSDIAGDSDSKTKLYSYKVFAGYCGLILFYAIPLLPFFDSTAITPETLKVTFWIAAILTVPFLIQAMRAVPSGPAAVASPESSASSKLSWAVLKEIASNIPFIIFIAALFCSGFAIGMWYGLIYIYVDAYLNMGEQFAKMFLIAFIVGLLVTPLWYQIAIRTGKKNAWMLAMVLMIISFVFTGLLEPGHTSFTQLLVLKTIQTCGYVCFTAVAPAMLSEIIDYSQWRSGGEQKATYFSAKIFLDKVNGTAGLALGLALAGWWGFDAAASEHSAEAVAGLKIAIVWVPTLVACLSLFFIALNPINERRHKAIRRRLDMRDAQAS